jgi:hypothetical protein
VECAPARLARERDPQLVRNELEVRYLDFGEAPLDGRSALVLPESRKALEKNLAGASLGPSLYWDASSGLMVGGLSRGSPAPRGETCFLAS